MQRSALARLETWLRNPARKPLVVNGARQVGKTWLVNEFGHTHFGSVAHVVFLENDQAQRIFEGSLDPQRILTLIGAVTGTNPASGKTLVFLDEIQECPRAITALKLFCEQTPEVPIIAAGSLLGVALNRRTKHDGEEARVSWPVGKVEYLDLFPMTFDEFVRAAGNDQLADLLVKGETGMIDALSEQLESLLRVYFFVGGMPEAVRAYVQSGNLGDARSVQSTLLRDYELDFSKHVESPLMTERIRETWRSVPSQLATQSDMKRFVYASIKAGGRGRDYRDAVSWLSDAGLVTKVRRISKPGTPLEGYADDTYFKLYYLDIGLLGAATQLEANAIINEDRLFTEYKGVYAEQYVCQHLLASGGRAPYYWSADGKDAKGEVDFVIERAGEVLPIEVKAGRNVGGTSISRFCQNYGVDHAVRLSMRGYGDQDWLTNVPLYAMPRFLP